MWFGKHPAYFFSEVTDVVHANDDIHWATAWAIGKEVRGCEGIKAAKGFERL
jgi:hypothetical protein